MKRLQNLLSVLALLTSSTNAWSFGGHLIVARIAQILLEKQNPQIVTQAVDVLKVFKSHYPSLTSKEGKYPFVECASFADEIKMEGGGFQSGWHFHDQEYLDMGGKPEDYQFVEPTENVTEALKAIIKWFKKEAGFETSTYYNTLINNSWPTNPGHTPEDAYSMALRLLIHFVGDQHQPLHSTTRVDTNYENGDMGGNMFITPSHLNCKNLHCVWDRVVYEWSTNPKFPFVDADFAAFDQKVQALMTKWPESKLNDVSNLDPSQW